MSTGAVTPDPYHVFFVASLDGALLATRDGDVLAANPAACALFGMTEGELRAAGWPGIATGPDAGGLLECLHSATRGAVTFVRKGGSSFVAEVRSAAGGGETRVVIIRERPVDQLLRRVDGLLRELSHELRTPLAAIRNTVYLMRHGQDGGGGDRFYDIIEEQVESLRGIVDDVTDATRIIGGRLSLKKRRLDLASVVKLVGERLTEALPALGVEVHLPQEEVVVHADPARIEQALVKVAEIVAERASTGTITMKLCRAHAEASISVRHSGGGTEFPVGIHNTFGDTAGDTGPGVGPTVVKGLTQLHGGTVRADRAEDGIGTVFTITLPLVEPKGEKSAAVPDSAPGRAKDILVVDDDRAAADSLAGIVRMWGHRVTVAYDGPSAVASAIRTPPQVILCDLNLPGMSGYEVAERIRNQQGEGVFMVALTGKVEVEDVLEARAAGFDKHLAKPLDVSDLRVVLAGGGEAESVGL